MKGQGSRQSGKWFFSVSGLTPTGLKNLNKVPRSAIFADKKKQDSNRGSEYPNIKCGSNTQKLFMFCLFKALFVLDHCSVHVCTMHTVCLCGHGMWTCAYSFIWNWNISAKQYLFALSNEGESFAILHSLLTNQSKHNGCEVHTMCVPDCWWLTDCILVWGPLAHDFLWLWLFTSFRALNVSHLIL